MTRRPKTLLSAALVALAVAAITAAPSRAGAAAGGGMLSATLQCPGGPNALGAGGRATYELRYRAGAFGGGGPIGCHETRRLGRLDEGLNLAVAIVDMGSNSVRCAPMGGPVPFVYSCGGMTFSVR